MREKYLQTTVCFKHGALTTADVLSLLDMTPSFTPTHVVGDEFKKSGGIYSSSDRDRIEKSASLESLLLSEHPYGEGKSFNLTRLPAWQFDAVTWQLPYNQSLSVPDFERVCEIAGFRCLYVADAADVFWQSTEEIAIYESRGRDHSKMPKRIDSDFGEEMIDVAKNPGARHLVPQFWLQSAWQMVFGGDLLNLFLAERLLDFSGAYIKRRLPCGGIFLQLYRDPDSFATPEARQAQAKFRQWMGYDAILAAAEDAITPLELRVFEIEAIGSRRRLVTWLDAGGEPTEKRHASWRLVQEIDSSGRLINEERYPA